MVRGGFRVRSACFQQRGGAGLCSCLTYIVRVAVAGCHCPWSSAAYRWAAIWILCCFDRGHDSRRHRTHRTMWPRSWAITLKSPGSGSVTLTHYHAPCSSFNQTLDGRRSDLHQYFSWFAREDCRVHGWRRKQESQTADSKNFPTKTSHLGHCNGLGWMIVPPSWCPKWKDFQCCLFILCVAFSVFCLQNQTLTHFIF